MTDTRSESEFAIYTTKANEKNTEDIRIEESAILFDLSVDLFTSALIVQCSALRVFH